MLILFYLFAVLSVPVQSNEYYIACSSPDCVNCPDCHPIEHYLDPANANDYSNSIFYFMKGTYNLNYSLSVSFNNVTLRAKDDISSSVILNIEQPIKFSDCIDLTLAYLTIKSTSIFNISMIQVDESDGFVMDHVYFEKNANLIMANTMGIRITNSFFSSEGTSVLYVSFTDSSLSKNDTTMNVENTTIITPTFERGNNLGITIQLNQSDYIVNVTMRSFYVATGNNGFNIVISNNGSYKYNLDFDNVTSTNSLGGIILYQAAGDDYSTNPQIVITNPQIVITNSIISFTKRTGVSIAWFSIVPGSISISSTLFNGNYGEAGVSSFSLIHYNQTSNKGRSNLKVYLSDVTFDDNKSNTNKYNINPSFQSVASFVAVSDISISKCVFSNNEGSGLFLFDSIVKFIDNNTFFNNTSFDGGGITMVSGSYLLLETTAFLNFTRNVASNKGGAILIAQVILDLSLGDVYNQSLLGYCFYRLLSKGTLKTYFHFESNMANAAGSVIYGGIISSCPLSFGVADTFSAISTYVNQSGPSIITSDGRNICFCDDNTDVPDCSLDIMVFDAFPAESITFSVAIVGQYHNTTTGVISIYDEGSLVTDENRLMAKCTSLNRTIRASINNKDVTFLVTLSESESNFIPTPKKVIVYIGSCQPGFYLSNQAQSCECPPVLKNNTVSCNAVSGDISSKGRLWFAYDDEYKCIINEECPFDYCVYDEKVTFTFNDTDPQCALDRSGLLCGQCAEGLSLMLGSNQCGECTNDNIALIIPFALAGIALVVFLIALNLTVSVGTINGLIFYANIVKIYESAFFPYGPIPILSQFISWINLDFGIQSCFIAGMNSTTKIGLQFIFPFYVWSLIVFIIILCHWSSRLSKAIGNNAVPVLATLLLLSYTKLLRTIILILSTAIVSCDDDTTNIYNKIVWYVDPNVEYLKDPRHIVLFVIALLILVILVVPYTLFLLLFPLFEILRSRWTTCTSFYLKFKPLFDAYAGPHNDHFRFWPGLLIVVRVILALVFGLSGTFIPPLSVLVAVVALLILCQMFFKVYKTPIHNNLDICFYICLFVIVYVIQYAVSTDNTTAVFDLLRIDIGLGVVLSVSVILSLAVIVYHIYLFPFQKLKTKIKSKSKDFQLLGSASLMESEEPEENYLSETPNVTFSTVTLREPLLDY